MMITREQIYTMLLLRKRAGNFFSTLPKDCFNYIINTDSTPESEINVALRLAASGLKKDMANLVGMVKANPRLLLQAGKVVTRAGIFAKHTTLYEFFLGEGDPYAAKQIEFGFAEIIPNGEGERQRQYNRYKPHIEALAQQVASKQPAFDLRPLFKIIKESITVGMHYKHYTTLSQAFDLLDSEWPALSDNDTSYDKCHLVWRQIIGYLQRSLPAVDRFAFARAFYDEERTLSLKYAKGSFPDVTHTDGDFDLSGLGFYEGIFGARGAWDGQAGVRCVGKHMSNKNFRLAELMQQQPTPRWSGCTIV